MLWAAKSLAGRRAPCYDRGAMNDTAPNLSGGADAIGAYHAEGAPRSVRRVVELDTPAPAVDATDPKDQGTIRKAIAEWPKRFAAIDEARKRRWVEGLDIAQCVGEEAAKGGEDLEQRIDGAALIVSAVKTGVMMEGLNQKDEHKAMDKMAPDLVSHEHQVMGVIGIKPGEV